ncbi:hypothetical protein GCM10007918_17140 [Piscinibacter gummiphilus]|nr:hypothetical protein GCM10007918_17140 [Piscinibacter gummiphilus]
MLRDGDSIEVQSTKIFQMCTRIMREGEQIDHYKHWKWFALLGGAMLIAVGIGWLKGDDDGDNNGISIRFG